MNGWFALLAFVIGWFIAQAWKTITGIWKGHRQAKKLDLAAFIDYASRSGGMPSGHSASMTAMTTYIGMVNGFNSGLFALALATTLIVVYDAIHVRYAVGEQGKALNGVLEKEGKKPLPVIEGHTMAQAVVGVLIGILTGVVMGVIGKA